MTEEHVDVIIIGAGVSGIGAAAHLKQRCPDVSYLILEARDDLGGTWDLFRYPGIRSDSDMYTFGYEFKPWVAGQTFADGPSIKSYVRETAREYDALSHIRFGHRMAAANWDSETARWTIEVERGENGERARITCGFLISCTGYYNYAHGYLPEFEGADAFQGDLVHPQHWPEDLDYAGKRVAIIGSGATAVTLVPAMAKTAGHVTMVQRSPTYIAARPQKDVIANFMRRILPKRAAYGVTRAKNVLLTIYFFTLAKRWPGFVKRMVLKGVRDELGEDFDVETHFTPSYNPWDQRFCLAPDGDFFASLRDGEASVVTGQIERFTQIGVLMKSGEEVEADIIIPATGLEIQLLGGARVSVDGRDVAPSECLAYRGMMMSGIPNFVIAFGYTNASWTLKIDLTFRRTCRLINYMQANGYDYCVAEAPADLETDAFMNLNSGYIQRAEAILPKNGVRPPWRNYQNYIRDKISIGFAPLEDGVLAFRHAGAQEAAPASPQEEPDTLAASAAE